jgi:5-methylcytosine-specific restriction endonuclease McrBC regulatory subunit McrC
MPNLFQSFVAEWLRENLPSKYRILRQYRATLYLEGKFHLQIDLVLTDKLSNSIFDNMRD